MNLAPIILFVYNRPEHTRQTVEHLLRNDEAPQSDLIVYCDGARHEGHKTQVDAVRGYVQSIAGFKSLTVTKRNENFGLAKSIISGVTEIVEKYGKAIILEDDIVVSKYFLSYMNRGLDFYEADERVASIHGWNYPLSKKELPDTFFLRGADCWGWATWKRAWDLFEPDGGKLLAALENQGLTHQFDLDGAYPYTQMLRDQIAGKNDSWAIRWYASAFLENMLTLYPGRSLVSNIGFDGSGVHCGVNEDLKTIPSEQSYFSLPKQVIENFEMRTMIIRHLKSNTQRSFMKRFVKKMQSILRRFY